MTAVPIETEPAVAASAAEVSAPRRRRIPVILPNIRDPRLHLGLTISAIQVLGQTSLGFDVSIAQILLTLATCALIEMTFTLRKQRALVWPASALNTGNGVALIIRVPGTEHGDWWSMRGWWAFVGIAAFSILSKYVIRWRGKHIFNPSNLGIVVGVVAFRYLPIDAMNELQVDLQDLWWGPMTIGLALTLVVIFAGAGAITKRLGLLTVALGFWLTFAAGVAVLAATGHSITARWHLGPLEDWSYWWIIVTSPETLIFASFMITDPKTTPPHRLGRIVFGMLCGAAATFMIAPLETELRTKTAILASLVVACTLRPVVDWAVPTATTSLRDPASRLRWATRPVIAIPALAVTVSLLILSGSPARPDSVSTPPGGPVLFDRADLPTVIVDPSVDGVSPVITQDRAEDVVLEVLNGLAIEHGAVTDGDLESLATVTTGDRLQYLEDSILQGSGMTTATYDFDEVTVTVHRGSPQSMPRIVLLASGTLVADGVSSPVVETIRLDRIANGRYLVETPIALLERGDP